jgi:hypothetical protein
MTRLVSRRLAALIEPDGWGHCRGIILPATTRGYTRIVVGGRLNGTCSAGRLNPREIRQVLFDDGFAHAKGAVVKAANDAVAPPG